MKPGKTYYEKHYYVLDLDTGQDIKYVTEIDTNSGTIERMEVDEGSGLFITEIINGVRFVKLTREKRRFRLVDVITGKEVTRTGDDVLPEQK